MKYLYKLPFHLQTRSFKYAIKDCKDRLKELIQLAYVWRYQFGLFSHNEFSNVKFYFIGLKSHQEAATLMLDLDSSPALSGDTKQRAFITGIPLLGSICIPHNLTSLIPLKNRSLDEVLMGFEKTKRRTINNAASGYLLNQISDIKEVYRLNQEMLMPYALARHGKTVIQLTLEFVAGMATKYGRLHLLVKDGKEVGCLIGFESICNKKRYWLMIREGFPDFIFNDKNSQREKHIMIIYRELEWAIENGYDYYDMGFNQAYPEKGPIQFKRSLGAELSTLNNYNFFYLKIPKNMAAKFYWENPQFAVEGKTVVLHLGLPEGKTANEVSERYKLLNFGGLSKVYLHCDSIPSGTHTESVMSIYQNQKSPPVIKVC